uniref:Complement C8 gamma chain n=1 Tax=Ficedula albicollis TaxID=59894 RepID=U3JQW6_FICAL
VGCRESRWLLFRVPYTADPGVRPPRPTLQPIPCPPPGLAPLSSPAHAQVQLAGKWFLVSMASRCSYLAEHSHQLEATTMTVTVLDGQSLAISTFRKLDRMCWEIRQHYLPAQAPGRFLLKGHRKSSKVDVVVGEADASSFVILYYQKGRSISVKLYGRLGLGASWHAKDRGGKPVLDSGEAS